ncbi:MAG TPA: class I SAM-dependent methyltransferase [Thermoanaerobaculia bacterium]
MIGMTPEMETLKTRLKATWNAGDYAHFAQPMEAATIEILERLAIPPGTEMLDVGCGAGQIAIPAARAGVRVTGLDLAPHQVEAARARARAESLDARFDEGDAEMLPYEDASFDVVVSLIGAMFAPRPDRVAAELARVCRPGGRIIMANWTAEGFVGQLFKIIGKHVPPSPLMASPLLWGHEPTVRERFQDSVSELKLTRYQFPFEYPLDPAETAEFYRLYYGPINRAFASLDDDRQAALREDLEQLWTQANEATDGTTRYGGEYLEVVAVRA